MTKEDIENRLTVILRDVFDDEEITASPELSAADIEEWDSLNHVRLMLTIEKAFGIKFAAAEISELKNVGDLTRLIQSKVS